MAGALDYTVLTVAVLGIASHVHRLPGWIRCPTASADVIMASALGIPMTDIVMPALQPEPGHIRSAS